MVHLLSAYVAVQNYDTYTKDNNKSLNSRPAIYLQHLKYSGNIQKLVYCTNILLAKPVKLYSAKGEQLMYAFM
jgi:hypothetical protein